MGISVTAIPQNGIFGSNFRALLYSESVRLFSKSIHSGIFELVTRVDVGSLGFNAVWTCR
jgi:hypothetical protein